jgi:hypothetical protein
LGLGETVQRRQSVAERDRVDREAVLVDQAVPGEGVSEAAAEADDVVAGLAFEFGDLVLDSASREASVAPLDAGQGAGEHEHSITLADPAAEGWLAELSESTSGEALPPVVTAVASRARSIVNGHAATGAIARARVRTASGVWLLVRASTLGNDADAQRAVIVEPARPHELAPLIADAYELTEREWA